MKNSSKYQQILENLDYTEFNERIIGLTVSCRNTGTTGKVVAFRKIVNEYLYKIQSKDGRTKSLFRDEMIILG